MEDATSLSVLPKYDLSRLSMFSGHLLTRHHGAAAEFFSLWGEEELHFALRMAPPGYSWWCCCLEVAAVNYQHCTANTGQCHMPSFCRMFIR